jgi:hypothetical protein
MHIHKIILLFYQSSREIPKGNSRGKFQRETIEGIIAGN